MHCKYKILFVASLCVTISDQVFSVAEPILLFVVFVGVSIYGYLFIVRQEPLVLGNTVITSEQKLGAIVGGTTSYNPCSS